MDRGREQGREKGRKGDVLGTELEQVIVQAFIMCQSES